MSAKPKKENNLVWVDLEMTGLDPKKCTILEIGAIVTDSELNIIAEGPEIAVHHSARVLDGMEAWSKFHHKKSGLTDACRHSKISLKKAEELTLKFVKSHCKQKTAPLCGNTIWQDRRFLVKYMPKLESYLHYRVVDVSSVKELVSRWYPPSFKMPRDKTQTHRVMDDLRESISELKYYRKKVFTVLPKTDAAMAVYPVSEKKVLALHEKMRSLGLKDADFEENFIRSGGAGGQNVNKVSTCVWLRHTASGLEVKCQQERSQALNRFFAKRQLVDKIEAVRKGLKDARQSEFEKIRRQKRRRSRRSKDKMLDAKKLHSQKKSFRGKIDY